MKKIQPGFIVLSILSAALLSAGFLLPHCGGFVLIGFVPLLWMDRIATKQGVRHFFWWHYLCFVLWNAATTFWVCNATLGGGIAAVLINALEMSVIWALFRLFKSKFVGSLPYIFLVCLWIAWERAYYSAEISWPWLTLGNAFATTTTCIQWYDVTGTIGGSLWAWLCNMAVFGLSVALYEGFWKGFNIKAKTALALSVVTVFIAPVIWSVSKYVSFREVTDRGYVTACALQPNLDPYLKFEKYTQDEQDDILCGLIKDFKNAASDNAAAASGDATANSDAAIDGGDATANGNAAAASGDAMANGNTADGEDATANGNAADGEDATANGNTAMASGDATVNGNTADGILFVAPETATNDVIVNDLSASKSLGHLLNAIGESDQVLFGASSYEFIASDKAPSYTARPYGKGLWYENHNSAILAGVGVEPQIYHKSRLVIGTEKMPWPRVFSKVDEWLGGGVIARCIGQDRVSLLALENDVISPFDPECEHCQTSVPAVGAQIPPVAPECEHCQTSVPAVGAQISPAAPERERCQTSVPAVGAQISNPVKIGCAVCYESVYPEYFASYVAAGAQAMAVITNDAWWGDTPGYHQHMSYSRLRAIETRRDIVRSANTGISCFINQRGDVVTSLDWDKRGSLSGRIWLNDHLTPFVRHGDIIGRLCTFLFLILGMALIVRLVLSRGKRTQSRHTRFTAH